MAELRTDYEDGELFLPDFLNNTNRRVNSLNSGVGNIQEQANGLQDTLDEFMGEHGTTPSGTSASAITLASGTGLNSSTAQQAFAELANEVFPLTVELGTNNAGSYEVGSEISPSMEIVATRRGAAVTLTANDVAVSPTGSYNASTGIVTDTAFTPPVAGSKTYTIEVTQGGQTKVVTAEYLARFYLYKGVLDSKPSPMNATAIKTLIEGSWRGSNKVLSNDKSLGNTNLAANKYYLFAVKQSAQGSSSHITLIVKNANSGGTIDVPSTDKGFDLEIERVNESGSDYYSWVIVPASPNSWNFKITNS